MFCLPKRDAEKFKNALRDGTIDPEKLSQMDSAGRREFFDNLLGKDYGTHTNALFESKLLLKNQQAGMITWAKQIAGLKPEAKRDLITRIEKMDKVLDPATEKEFLNDLAAHKLGTAVTFNEASLITELSKQIQQAREAKAQGGDRMEYGRSVVALNNYVKQLKKGSTQLTLADFKSNPIASTARLVGGIPGTLKAIQASMDNSSIFRQGWKPMFTNPGIWARNAAKSFKDLFTLFGQDRVMNELNADILSRPNAENGYYKKAKLDVGTVEEDFPTSVPEAAMSGLNKAQKKLGVAGYALEIPKLPLRLYEGSQNAYTAFVHKTRADVFDKEIKIAEKMGIELTDNELLMIGRMVNSLTGRGNLGSLEGAGKFVNNVLFSPKLLKSHIDTLGGHVITGGANVKNTVKGTEAPSAFVRKEAAKNLAKMITGGASILTIAYLLKPDSIELDPRSSDFGKIKIGNTRIEVFGGQSGLLTLTARLAALAINGAGIADMATTKSGDKLRYLNEKDKAGKPKFGSRTGWDLLEDFFENKMAPGAGFLRDMAKGHRFGGEPLTAGGMLLDSVTPISAKNYQELEKDPDSMNTLAAMILDGLGAATNTYGRENLGTKTDITKEDLRVELQKKLDDGEITQKQMDNQLKAVDDNPLVEKFKNADDPDRIESLLKFMDKPSTPKEAVMVAQGGPEIQKALLKKIQNLNDNADMSPKDYVSADKLEHFNRKYFQGSTEELAKYPLASLNKIKKATSANEVLDVLDELSEAEQMRLLPVLKSKPLPVGAEQNKLLQERIKTLAEKKVELYGKDDSPKVPKQQKQTKSLKK